MLFRALAGMLGICTLALSHASAGEQTEGGTVRLRNTYYYVCLESVYAGKPRTVPIRDRAGNVLAMVSPAFKRAVDIEGTGRLLDGRLINFAARIDGEIRYLVTDAPYGIGVGKCQLKPFHTVAVDPTVVPLGSLVHIAETEGMWLPDGSRHDGYWRAEDIGGAIKHDRVDLFVGDGNRGDILEAAGIKNLMPLTVTVVEPPQPGSCVEQVLE
jgi:3D (Asp-Asp-Asp) domain-containing protein